MTVGGWSALEGAKALQIAYIVVYLVIAFYVARWNRGVLPVAAALAIILLIFAAVSGPAWFDRDKTGFTDPALSSSLLGLLTMLIVPVQVLLIAFAMRASRRAGTSRSSAATTRRPMPCRRRGDVPLPIRARVAQLAEAIGSNPIQCGFESRPGYSSARLQSVNMRSQAERERVARFVASGLNDCRGLIHSDGWRGTNRVRHP